MPRFFFHIYDGRDFKRDVEGLELPDTKAVHGAAVASLTEMARRLLADQEQCDIVVEVQDEAGQRVYTANVSLASRWAMERV
jgi:H2-forming N5,N10-methylenetetrahydromethanopterin dehydrogenase-like enzyme